MHTSATVLGILGGHEAGQCSDDGDAVEGAENKCYAFAGGDASHSRCQNLATRKRTRDVADAAAGSSTTDECTAI